MTIIISQNGSLRCGKMKPVNKHFVNRNKNSRYKVALQRSNYLAFLKSKEKTVTQDS